MDSEEAKQIAQKHWEWLVTWLKLVYIDAFIHGYKHGKDSEKKDKGG